MLGPLWRIFGTNYSFASILPRFIICRTDSRLWSRDVTKVPRVIPIMSHFPVHVLVQIRASSFLMESHRSLEVPHPFFLILPSARAPWGILMYARVELTTDFPFISIDCNYPDSNRWAPNRARRGNLEYFLGPEILGFIRLIHEILYASVKGDSEIFQILGEAEPACAIIKRKISQSRLSCDSKC